MHKPDVSYQELDRFNLRASLLMVAAQLKGLEQFLDQGVDPDMWQTKKQAVDFILTDTPRWFAENPGFCFRVLLAANQFVAAELQKMDPIQEAESASSRA